MKKLYKITSIVHSGNKGKRNTPRTDGRYPMRIGRIVELDTDYLVDGSPLVLDYVKDENGNDYRGMSLFCSIIKDWDYVSENVIDIETRNSIYELEELSLIPLGGKYDGVYGAYFCRNCKEFLGFNKLAKRCPLCKTKVDWEHKMKYVDGKWIKIKEWT